MMMDTLSGDDVISKPSARPISEIFGSVASGAMLRVCGVDWPGRISGPVRSPTMMPAAMKLNMIVVMTTWLPRVACRKPGRNAHAAPKSAAAKIAIGMTRRPGT